MLTFDHLGIPSRDPRGAAHTLAQLLGAGAPVPDGADDDLFRIDLELGGALLFLEAKAPAALHVAFSPVPIRG